MQTVDEIDAQIEALIRQREEAAKMERDVDLETVRTLCRKHGFYASDLGNALKKRKKRVVYARKKAAGENAG